MVDVAQLHTTQQAEEGSRPRGTWSGAPALAASTVAMKNTSGYTVEVNVTGGTVTAASRNGVAITGITATGFRIVLAPGSTVAITYSVAPTLQWLYT